MVNATFTLKNDGQEIFHVYKVDSDAKKFSCGQIQDTKPGQGTSFKFSLDTSMLPVGEHLTIVTLTTNSPFRPIVNLFIAGYITE